MWTRAIIQKNLKGNIIGKFKTLKKAVEKTGANPTGIVLCCRKKQKTCLNSFWEYDNANSKKQLPYCPLNEELDFL